MAAPVTCKTMGTARGIVGTAAFAVRQLSRPRTIATVVGITIMIAIVTLVPLPTAVQLRDWATSVGPWFPFVFLLAHAFVTVVPFPRTAFTLASGLLFGPVCGVLIAVLGSTSSAVIALLLVRAAGWRLNGPGRHRAVGRLDERLRERGWLTVLSLRLIPAVPFSALNYAAGASAVRVMPYTLATLGGMLPGTAAVVILGDALAGHVSPFLYLVSLCTGALGVTGLIIEFRHYRKQRQRRRENNREAVSRLTDEALSNAPTAAPLTSTVQPSHPGAG